MLRLTRTTRLPHEVVLRVEGQMVAEWVGLLEGECLEILGSDRKVLLDLADVSFLDHRAARMLRRMAQGQVSLINCSPLVEELLAEDVG